MNEKECLELKKALDGKIHPVDDVIIAVKLTTSETAGGIVLPENNDASKTVKKAYVLATGPGVREDGERVPLPCSAGQYILVSGYAGMVLGETVRAVVDSSIKGTDIVLLRSCDVLATL